MGVDVGVAAVGNLGVDIGAGVNVAVGVGVGPVPVQPATNRIAMSEVVTARTFDRITTSWQKSSSRGNFICGGFETDSKRRAGNHFVTPPI